MNHSNTKLRLCVIQLPSSSLIWIILSAEFLPCQAKGGGMGRVQLHLPHP